MMVEFNSVSFSYTENGTGAVHDISFAIPEGQFVLVCGASGCGKTTITRLINSVCGHAHALYRNPAKSVICVAKWLAERTAQPF